MRFNIRDLLLLTILCAFIGLCFQQRKRLENANHELRETVSKATALSQLNEAFRAERVHPKAAIDYADEVKSIHDAIENSFKVAQKRHGKVEPSDHELRLRLIPSVPPDNESKLVHFRVNVPKSPAIYLKSAMKVVESGTKHDMLDEIAWHPIRGVENSGPSSIRLKPGLHDIHFASNRESEIRTLQITVDDELVFRAEKKKSKYRPGSLYFRSKGTITLDFRRSLPNLNQFTFRTEYEQRVVHVAWFSLNPDFATEVPLPGVVANQVSATVNGDGKSDQ